ERRFRAARLVAAALQARGAYTRAEIWLRRALQNASDPRLEAIATRDYEYVRRRNPWTTRLRFGLTPSSNINNGSKSDTMVIGGLPFALSGAAQALSGLEISYGAETRYRHAVGDRVMLHLGGAIEGKSYRLSAGSRAKAPDLDASDLAYQAAELNFGVAWRPAPDAGPIGLDLTLGKSFYGGDPLADYARAEMTKRVRLGPRTILRFKAAAEEQWRQDVARNSSTALIGGAALRRKLGNGDRLSVGVGLRDTASDAGTVAHEAKMATIDYRFAKPLAGAELGLSLSYEGRQYDRAVYGASPRSDDRLALGVSVFLPDLDYYGFAPEIGLSAVRNNSNVALYDSEDYGLTVSFKSSF
ncbi:MAG: surface lipoprotein assembly modifier, partial [Paracoccaceae bacterium]